MRSHPQPPRVPAVPRICWASGTGQRCSEQRHREKPFHCHSHTWISAPIAELNHTRMWLSWGGSRYGRSLYFGRRAIGGGEFVLGGAALVLLYGGLVSVGWPAAFRLYRANLAACGRPQ